MNEISSNVYESLAQEYETLQTELEKAVRHCATAAQHFRETNIPRGCAHAFAIQGHLYSAQDLLKQLSILHSRKARTNENTRL